MRVSAAGVAVLWLAVVPRAVGQDPVPPATEAPASAPAPARPTPRPRLKLDIGRHVDEVVSRQESASWLRFEDRIEVTDRSQEALDALLRGLELACSPSQDGPPPTSELNTFKAVPIPPTADFLAAAKSILKAIRKNKPSKKPPDWFLYAVHRDAETRLVVRKSELSLSERLAVPGTTWEEIARFDNSGEATAALRRLERGFDTIARATPGDPPPPGMPLRCTAPKPP